MAGLPVIQLPQQRPHLAEAISGGVRGFIGGQERQREIGREKKEDEFKQQMLDLREKGIAADELRSLASIRNQLDDDESWNLFLDAFLQAREGGTDALGKLGGAKGPQPKPVRGKTFTEKPSEVPVKEGFLGKLIPGGSTAALSPGQEIIAEMIRDIDDARVVIENPQHFVELVKSVGFEVSIEDVKAVANEYRTPEMLKATTNVLRPPGESVMGRFGQGLPTGAGLGQFLGGIPGTGFQGAPASGLPQHGPQRTPTGRAMGPQAPPRPAPAPAASPSGQPSRMPLNISPSLLRQPEGPPTSSSPFGAIAPAIGEMTAPMASPFQFPRTPFVPRGQFRAEETRPPAGPVQVSPGLGGLLSLIPGVQKTTGATPTAPQAPTVPREVELQTGIGAERTIRARFKANGKVYEIPADKFNPDEWERL